MGRKPKRNAAEVIEAIDGTGGIKTTIAQKLGVTRHTVDGYLDRWVTVQQAYRDEVERVGDMAEMTLLKAIKDGDTGAAKWYLSRVRRGKFAKRQEITGSDGGPLVVVNWDGAENTD